MDATKLVLRSKLETWKVHAIPLESIRAWRATLDELDANAEAEAEVDGASEPSSPEAQEVLGTHAVLQAVLLR